jgi:hypothetical protein
MLKEQKYLFGPPQFPTVITMSPLLNFAQWTDQIGLKLVYLAIFPKLQANQYSVGNCVPENFRQTF